ncbi:MAG: hypothetical protein EPN36_11035 [Rhodanobacteraceae bacterium]|nr:MAG: hypothetical protein EPN36_11035 [Rhodanobacteraceae bacterium]
MNVQKSVAVFAAMLITAAGMGGISSYSNMVASGNRGINASSQVIKTLPTIHVHPTKEQMLELRGNQAGAAPANLRMPYYSFASDDSAGA